MPGYSVQALRIADSVQFDRQNEEGRPEGCDIQLASSGANRQHSNHGGDKRGFAVTQVQAQSYDDEDRAGDCRQGTANPSPPRHVLDGLMTNMAAVAIHPGYGMSKKWPTNMDVAASAYCRAVDSTLRSSCPAEDWRG
jgi:hypothetical protein